ncbi:MAG TPA: amidohydrolase family protein [Gemmatimonadaceae bacterium]|nr:amidohydrolase family protein [Gemmatimonadaceae bacterium]
MPARRVVRSIILLCAVCPIASLGAQQGGAAAGAESPLVFEHVTVVDVEQGRLLADRRVVIDGTRIIAVDSGSHDGPAGARRVDGTGKYLIPGLWDMHVHAAHGSYGRGLPANDSGFAPLFIANGVTGVRDMFGVEGRAKLWKAHVRNGTAPWPRIVVSQHILDGPQAVWPGSVRVATAAAARRAVDSLVRAGADFLKVYSFLPRDAFRAAVEQAGRRGLPVAGHVPFVLSVEDASDAGMRSIEHMTGIPAACSTVTDSVHAAYLGALDDPDVLAAMSRVGTALGPAILSNPDPTRCAALAERLSKNGTWLSPTLTVLRSTAHLDDTTLAGDQRTRFVPGRYLQLWDPRNDFRFRNVTAEGWGIRRRMFARQLEIVGHMARAGVPVIAGTDFGNPWIFAGFSLHDELGLLVQAGLTPLEALRAATLGPARYLDATDSLGTVERGKLADLVLLDADPLADITNTTKIRAVVANGRYLDRAALDALLAGAERRIRGETP